MANGNMLGVQGLLGKCVFCWVRFAWHQVRGYQGAQLQHFDRLHAGCLGLLG